MSTTTIVTIWAVYITVAFFFYGYSLVQTETQLANGDDEESLLLLQAEEELPGAIAIVVGFLALLWPAVLTCWVVNRLTRLIP